MGHGNDGETSEFDIAMAALGRATEGMRILRFGTAEAECKDAMGQSVDSFFDMREKVTFWGYFHDIPCLFLYFFWGLLYCWVIALLGFWVISCFCLQHFMNNCNCIQMQYIYIL